MLDLGFAHLDDASVALTADGDLLGTPIYMAPEQVAGQADDIGPATDVHALGAILYEVLTGRPPYAARNLAGTLNAILSGRIERPGDIAPAVPPALERAALRALAHRPSDRHPSAAALAAELAGT